MGDYSESMKARVVIFECDTRLDLFYITVKYHQNIPNCIQVIEQTRKCLQRDVQVDRRMDDRRQSHRYIP